jgi:hypothetical protein
MRWAVGLVLAATACGRVPGEPEAAAATAPRAPTSRTPERAAVPTPAPSSAPDDQRVGGRPWIDPTGTAIVGFGILRIVPDAGKRAVLSLRYTEKPSAPPVSETPPSFAGPFGVLRFHAGPDKSDRYDQKPSHSTVGEDFQLFVLPGDAFANKSSAYADELLAYSRTLGTASGNADFSRRGISAQVEVDQETTVLVCAGPLTTTAGSDVGRPAGDEPMAVRTDVIRVKDGCYEWIEPEAGELFVTNWTNRPQVKRGGPYVKDEVWLEVRPMVLYDGRLVRASDEPCAVPGDPPCEDPERLADQKANARRWDRRIVMTRELAERFRRVPTRWR